MGFGGTDTVQQSITTHTVNTQQLYAIHRFLHKEHVKG